eukprot:757213-Hanusia_phi.AAC.3
MVYHNGCEYVGEFERSRRSGFGCLTSVNGVRYEGEWRNDLKHGAGLLLFGLPGVQQDGRQLGKQVGSWWGGAGNSAGRQVGFSSVRGVWYEDRVSGRGEAMMWDGRKIEGFLREDETSGTPAAAAAAPSSSLLLLLHTPPTFSLSHLHHSSPLPPPSHVLCRLCDSHPAA